VFEAVIGESSAEPAAKARFMLGEIAFAEKKFPEAIEQFLLCSEGYAYPHWQGLARVETARAFLELGDKPEAIKALENLLAKQADHAKAADAKLLLSELKK
jgi:TolA-binding protein